MFILDAIDVVGYRPHLTTFRKNRYKSTIGKIIGFLTVFPLIGICFYFVVTTFQKKEIAIVYNESADYVSTVNLTLSPIFMVLTNGLDAAIPDALHEIRVNYWSFSKNTTLNQISLENYEIPLEPCNSTHMGEHASLFQIKNLTGLKCIPYNKYDLSLKGFYGDGNSNTFLNIAVNACNNQTRNNECPNETLLEQYLKNVYLIMVYMDYEIDHYNYATPIKPVVRTHTFPINWDIHSRYFFTFKSLFYNSDNGLIFEDKSTNQGYKFESNQQNLQIRRGSLLYSSTIGTVTISREPISNVYDRAYPKIQTLFAKIGGLVQGILFLSKALCYLITRNLFIVDLINSNFKSDDFNSIIEGKDFSYLKSWGNNSNNGVMSTSSAVIKIRADNLKKSLQTITPLRKEKKFQPSCWILWLHTRAFPLRNIQSQYMNKVMDFINKRMSYDNMFRHLVEYERLKKILFNLDQLALFENLPKMTLEEIHDRPTVMNRGNYKKIVREIKRNGEDNINNNLLKHFKYNIYD